MTHYYVQGDRPKVKADPITFPFAGGTNFDPAKGTHTPDQIHDVKAAVRERDVGIGRRRGLSWGRFPAEEWVRCPNRWSR